MSVVVLGLGNILCGDDGFGVAAAAALERAERLPSDVAVVDGGTQGIYLLPVVTEAERLLILDAVDIGAAPGTLVVLDAASLAEFQAGGRNGAHDGGVAELLALAGLSGWQPRALALVGAQIAAADLGAPMSAAVAGCLPLAVARAQAILADWRARAA